MTHHVTQTCMLLGHVRSGSIGENVCYTCAFAARGVDVFVGGHIANSYEQPAIDIRPGAVNYVKGKPPNVSIYPKTLAKGTQGSIEHLANNFLASILQAKDANYETNPVLAAKQARWYLDNLISQMEKKHG